MNNPIQHRGHPSYDTGQLTIGEGTQIDDTVFLDLCDDIIIGNHCKITRGVKIYTHDHVYSKDKVATHSSELKKNPVIIFDNVWLGEECVILHQASHVGEGAVIGIRAVVTQPVPAWEIWAGNPARKVGERQ